MNPSIDATIRRLESHADALLAQLELAADAASRASIQATRDVVTAAIVGLRSGDRRLLEPVAPSRRVFEREVREVRVSMSLVPRRVRTVSTRAQTPALPQSVAPARPPQLGPQVLSAPCTYRPPADRELEYELAWTPHRDAKSLIGNYPRKGSTL